MDFLTDHSTTVPRIDINTVGGVYITSKEYYVDAEIIIDGAGVFPSMTDAVKIKGRGNSSWSNNPKIRDLPLKDQLSICPGIDLTGIGGKKDDNKNGNRQRFL